MLKEFKESLIENHPDWIEEAKEISKSLSASEIGIKKREFELLLEQVEKEQKGLSEKYSELVKEKTIYSVAYEMECGYWKIEEKKGRLVNIAKKRFDKMEVVYGLPREVLYGKLR